MSSLKLEVFSQVNIQYFTMKMTSNTSRQNISILKHVMVTFIPFFHHKIFFFTLIICKKPRSDQYTFRRSLTGSYLTHFTVSLQINNIVRRYLNLNCPTFQHMKGMKWLAEQRTKDRGCRSSLENICRVKFSWTVQYIVLTICPPLH